MSPCRRSVIACGGWAGAGAGAGAQPGVEFGGESLNECARNGYVLSLRAVFRDDGRAASSRRERNEPCRNPSEEESPNAVWRKG